MHPITCAGLISNSPCSLHRVYDFQRSSKSPKVAIGESSSSKHCSWKKKSILGWNSSSRSSMVQTIQKFTLPYHERWICVEGHTLPDSRFFRLVVFFCRRCALPADLLVILPLPVTLNLLAEACQFINPHQQLLKSQKTPTHEGSPTIEPTNPPIASEIPINNTTP